MSRETVVAKRYARALYEIASREGRTLEVEHEVKAVVDALTSDKQMTDFITSPNISESVKLGVMDSLQDKLSGPVVSLVKLLIERGRTEILPELLQAYVKISGDALGFANATVYTTYPLNNEQQQQVAGEFSQLVNKQVRVENVIDANLLGGMKVRIGDTVYDGSLAGKLERLEKSFRSR